MNSNFNHLNLILMRGDKECFFLSLLLLLLVFSLDIFSPILNANAVRFHSINDIRSMIYSLSLFLALSLSHSMRVCVCVSMSSFEYCKCSLRSLYFYIFILSVCNIVFATHYCYFDRKCREFDLRPIYFCIATKKRPRIFFFFFFFVLFIYSTLYQTHSLIQSQKKHIHSDGLAFFVHANLIFLNN